ncbi:MAG: FIST N-terminal domain-containing protein [Hyphomicrobiaceae bacterium]|nr:FIST N-terminal domain-containing protein [Hyphomicrobiaceae bacterium]
MGRASSSVSTSGICWASSDNPILDEAVIELRSALAGHALQHIVTFFSLEHDAGGLSAALTTAFPGVRITGCSTAGEITPSGMIEGGIVLIGFPPDGFRIHTGLIENIDEFGVERATHIVRKLKEDAAKGNSDGQRNDRTFALLMIDGMSNAEETLVAAIHWAMDDVQLVGGSAGDDLAFERTALVYDGRPVQKAAILMMVESDFDFRVFKTQNFDPTTVKLVVTAADTENRIVYELNAEPAALEYASAIGLMPNDLGPFSFASYPLVVKVGGDYFCRSIRNMNTDGSLSFFCAIDEGLVFTVARPQDMIRSTTETFDDIERSLGGIDFVIGFDCILRRLDAENRQIRRELNELYNRYRVVGFHTYGEQYNAMHLNQTLTGIAFGTRAAPRP